MTTILNRNLKTKMHHLRKQGRLALLLQLILHSNVRGRCWPSTKTLVDNAGWNTASITAAKQWLVSVGAIEIVPYDKRVNEELKLSQRKHIYQLTGKMCIDGDCFQYLYYGSGDENYNFSPTETSPTETSPTETSVNETSVNETKVIKSNKVIKKSTDDKSSSDESEKLDTSTSVTVSKGDIASLCYPGIKAKWFLITRFLNNDASSLEDLNSESLKRYGFWLVLASKSGYKAQMWKETPEFGIAPTPGKIKNHWQMFLDYEAQLPDWFAEIEEDYRDILESDDNWLFQANKIAKLKQEQKSKRKSRKSRSRRDAPEIKGMRRGWPDTDIAKRSKSLYEDDE